MLSDNQIELLKHILYNMCTENKPVPRIEIFNEFEKRAKSGLEKDKFETALSRLIRQGRISGYKAKVGRNGGIMNTEPIQRVQVLCSTGTYIGCVPESQVLKFISQMQKVHFEY